MSSIKKIGLLTSGGDCAGLNTAIRAVVKSAFSRGWEVYGIKQGTVGLMERPLSYIKFEEEMLGDLIRRGGTVLGSVNKGDPFGETELENGEKRDNAQSFIDGYRELGLDALIGIGGDGSMRIIDTLAKKGGIKFVGIPKTIDNDVAFNDYAIGFMTAVEVVIDAIDRLRTTALSHNRVQILEVMGRDAGHLALSSGIAGGADVILLPEIPFDAKNVIKVIEKNYKQGLNHTIIVCSEAANMIGAEKITKSTGKYGGIGVMLEEKIREATSFEVRSTSLGHIQRGGDPCAFDRRLATEFGVKAVELLAQGETGYVVTLQGNELVPTLLDKIAGNYNEVKKDSHLVNVARGMGISLGDE